MTRHHSSCTTTPAHKTYRLRLINLDFQRWTVISPFLAVINRDRLHRTCFQLPLCWVLESAPNTPWSMRLALAAQKGRCCGQSQSSKILLCIRSAGRTTLRAWPRTWNGRNRCSGEMRTWSAFRDVVCKLYVVGGSVNVTSASGPAAPYPTC